MLTLLQKQQGVTLIEMMIGLAIVAVLLAAGMPSFSDYIKNTKIRTAAESIQNGLQLARTEAVKNNAEVKFSLTDASGKIIWSVGCVTVTATCPDPIQQSAVGEGGTTARVGITTAAVTTAAAPYAAGTGLVAALPYTGVTFNNLGRVKTANIGTDITRADITDVSDASARWLTIIVSNGGQIRMCNPAANGQTPPNPQGCF